MMATKKANETSQVELLLRDVDILFKENQRLREDKQKLQKDLHRKDKQIHDKDEKMQELKAKVMHLSQIEKRFLKFEEKKEARLKKADEQELNKKEVSYFIKQHRLARGLNVCEVAAQFGFGDSTWGSLEKGVGSLETMLEIAEYISKLPMPKGCKCEH